jgi:hypothetical protein
MQYRKICVVSRVGFNQNSRWVALLVMKYVVFGKNCLGFVMISARPAGRNVAKKVTGDGFWGRILGGGRIWEYRKLVWNHVPFEGMTEFGAQILSDDMRVGGIRSIDMRGFHP